MSTDPRPLVMHVIHHLRMGGMENGVVNLVNRMPADAYRHAIVCVEDDSDFRRRIERPDVEVLCLHRSRIGVWGLRRELLRLFRDAQPSVVHTRNLSGLDALAPAAFAGVPVRIHGEHGRDADDPLGLARKPALLRRLHRPFVHRYVTVSTDLADYLVQRTGVPRGSIEHICNGVDTERFSPRTSESGSMLPETFRQPDAWVIGTVGRAQAVKDQATLLEGFAKLLAHPVTRAASRRPMLAIVGDGPMLGSLRDRASGLGIADRVWLPGARDDVSAVLQAMDVFVLPSVFEGISNTVLEAMACGLPVLATAVGGNPELVSQGVTGYTFTVGDVDALAGRLADYLADEPLRSRHAAASRRAAIDRFSLDAMTERYRSLYDHALRHGA